MELGGLLITMGAATAILGGFLRLLARSGITPMPNASDARKSESQRFTAETGRHAPIIIRVGLVAIAAGVVVAVVSAV